MSILRHSTTRRNPSVVSIVVEQMPTMMAFKTGVILGAVSAFAISYAAMTIFKL